MNISVLGMGYIGLPTSIMFAKSGHRVLGYDTNPDVVAALSSGQVHLKEKGLQGAFSKVISQGSLSVHGKLEKADVYIIAVPTPFKENETAKKADISYIESAAREVASVLKKDDLVILESTVPPFTTKRMTDILEAESELSRDSFFTAHCPERVLPGNIMYELENNDRVIGAEREESAGRARDLYASFVKSGDMIIRDDVTAEMCKLVENSYRDVNIAFANELSVMCEKINVNVTELIHLANKHPRVNILNPGVGVGGHCIAIDPWFLVSCFEHEAKLIRRAREINDGKPYWTADIIENRVSHDTSKRIGVLGLAYKPNIDDFRESPSIKLAHILMERGYAVAACEPNASVEELDGIRIEGLDEILSGSDLIVMTLAHMEFIENLDKIKGANSIIL